ncbi:MAG: hypothetical protein IKB82_02655, partial [Clostridia bacterium]|nr:hypothetical protein [Clostridia bacterium]
AQDQAGCAQQKTEIWIRRTGGVGSEEILVNSQLSKQIDDEEHRQLLHDAARRVDSEPDKGAFQRHMALIAHVARAGFCRGDAAEGSGEHKPDQVEGLRRGSQQEGQRR